MVRAARQRCVACVPAARRGCFGLGTASDGGGRGRRTLRRAVGVCALAPAACAQLRWLSGCLRRVGAGFAQLARGSMRSGKALRGGGVRSAGLRLTLPYPGRLTPRRFLAVHAARERCGACLGVPAARRGSSGLGATSDGSGWGRSTPRRAVVWCELALAARALLRWLSGRLRLAGAAWARLARAHGVCCLIV